MINTKHKQAAIIKKDVTGILLDRTQLPVLLIVPAVFTILIPTLFIGMAFFGIDNMADFQQMLDLLAVDSQYFSDPVFITEILLNYIMPVFFLFIPIMVAMIMAASSFVGEKENRTLETLLYSPLSLKAIFQAKVFASFLLSMLVSIGSFLIMLLVVEGELLLLTGGLYLPGFNWLITMLLVSPSIALISITLIVRYSAKAQTMQESQQRAVFLILPLLLLIAGQFTGIVLVGPGLLLVLGVIFAITGMLLLWGAVRNFNYETLLK